MKRPKKIEMNDKLLIGRNEWCSLPALRISAIKAKIDTGAKTSAIHVLNVKTKSDHGKEYVNFDVPPVQGTNDIIVNCELPIIDERMIMSSNGHKEHRYVVKTLLGIGKSVWNIELTLSNRDPLRYRMLLGREALQNRVLIDPSLTYHQSRAK